MAGPVFVSGGAVRGKTTDGARDGLFGGYPALTDLDDGDLRHNTDFRRVYASRLSEWLGADHRPLGLFA